MLALSYSGRDDIGREQKGVLRLDAKTGLPREVRSSQEANSPRDDGGYENAEKWTLLQVTR